MSRDRAEYTVTIAIYKLTGAELSKFPVCMSVLSIFYIRRFRYFSSPATLVAMLLAPCVLILLGVFLSPSNLLIHVNHAVARRWSKILWTN